MIKPIKSGFILVLLLSVFLTSEAFSQKQGLFSRQKVVNQYATFGVGGGTSHYFGDLAPYRYAYYGLYTNVRWNGTINYTRYLTSKVAARVSYSFARIFGDDYTFSQRNPEKLYNNTFRNLHFRNDISEFTVSGIYNLMPQYGKGAKGRNKIMPYVSVGIGFVGHNPKARGSVKTIPAGSFVGDLEPWQSLKQYNTSGQGLPGNSAKSYSLIVPVMPLSLGFRIKLNKNFDFAAEAGIRITPTQYLDDVGGKGSYPDPLILENAYGQDAPNFSYRANEDNFALTGQPRQDSFIQAIINSGNSSAVGSTSIPSLNAKNFYEYTTIRATTSKPDSYILTQFTISYVISNGIKCPKIP